MEFLVLDQKAPDGGEITVRRRMNKSLAKRATFFAFVSALLGREVPKNFSDSHLLNRKAKLLISHSLPDRDGRIWGNVDRIVAVDQ